MTGKAPAGEIIEKQPQYSVKSPSLHEESRFLRDLGREVRRVSPEIADRGLQ